MTNERSVYIKSGIKPVHGFDLWGTLVNQLVLGPRVIEAYQALMHDRATTEDLKAKVTENIKNYQGVLDGKDWATGQEKGKFVGNVEDPLWHAYSGGKAEVNFQGALYDDALGAMDNIAVAGQGLCIITTGKSFWIKKALNDMAPEIGIVMGEVYFGSKSKPAPYDIAIEDISKKGGQLVSHTEDQLKGFAGLFDSRRAMFATGDEHLVHRLIPSLMFQTATVYVERTNLATPEEVRAAGITAYTTDLRTVPYTSMVRNG
ncbi:hypothetical protein HN695_03175 [Candidatus Woesearchaeota archaeon]|nr:hypothetical protein [Candidatus Woesearchaeota archaeon]MBT5271778.1 hypothetical protein [Candidatus Woesearchaeota archaeon]MBT6041181.1 hypothetical protein [Candidatus Woesearchaeota archaeon]MBT6336302.1 hypothetical protein [Candidatus Woesearchaeota archaeon]MBT7927312.1 hypothetical protein [Candidatus Woesearchaeota archaeon]